MKENIWTYIKRKLVQDIDVVLCVVLESKGSSPGKAGFKMAIVGEGDKFGTIGGGNVEYNLIHKALSIKNFNETEVKIIKQVHTEEENELSSGMLCSGEQTMVLYLLDKTKLPEIEKIIDTLNENGKVALSFNNKKISVLNNCNLSKPISFEYNNIDDWNYFEELGYRENVYIFGAGHICLALSELLNKLGFYIHIIDDRDNLEQMVNNVFVNEKSIIDYKDCESVFDNDPNGYIIIMTHSHKADHIVLSKMIDKEFRYLGMMGSPAKVKEIYDRLKNNGISIEKLRKVDAPIGLKINSKTVDEIAVSIAAKLIQIRNQ